MQNRAYSLLTVKAVDEDQRIIRGMATTPETDRVGDVVDPMGAQFKNPAPLLWMHKHDLPVGTVNFGTPTKNGIPFEARLPKIEQPAALKARIDEAWESVKAGIVAAVSIGFNALEWSIIEATGGYRFSKSEILELSLVTVPANAGATIQMIKSIDSKVLAALGKKDKALIASIPSGASENNTVKLSKSPKEGKMKVSEQIKSFQTERAAKAARMEEIMTSSAEAGETLDAAQEEEYDTLNTDVQSIDKHLVRLDALQKAQLANAKAVNADDVDTTDKAAVARSGIQLSAPKPEKGIEFARFTLCLAAAKGNLTQAKEIALHRFPNDKDLNLSLKAAVEAGTTLDTTWAAPLVESYQRFAGDFVEFLRPQTILGKFGADGIPALRRVPFNISIAGQSTGGAGYWVGEGAPKPLTAFDFSATNLRWAKVANIAVITEELARFSNPAAEGLVRDGLAGALRERMDIDFIDPLKAAVANVSPASITNGIAPIASSGNSAVDIRNDIAAAFGQFIAANNAPTQGVWIMSSITALGLSLMRNALGQKEFPDINMLGGKFEGLPVIVSEYVPSDSSGSMIVLVNASDIFLADDGQVAVDASREASLQMLDNPTNNSATGMGTSMVSMFQTNSIAIRAERYINWQRRRAAAVAVISGVNYAAAA